MIPEPSITDWIMVAFTLAIVVFTILTWCVYKRIAWFTGAMESHSERMLWIESLRGINGMPIELWWWDPGVQNPATEAAHGKRIALDRIRVYLPPRLRRRKPSILNRFRERVRRPRGAVQ